MKLSVMPKGKNVDNRPHFRPCYGVAMSRYAGPTSIPTGWSDLFSTILPNYTAIRLVQKRYNWSCLETSLGVYNGSHWDEIDADLAALRLPANQGGTRLLSILIESKIFDQTNHVVPAFMRDGLTDFYGGGEFDYTAIPGFANGRIIRFDNINVLNRAKLLAAEFGRRYKDELQIEFITFPETTPGGTTIIPYNEAVHLAASLELLTAFKVAMPNHMIRQIFNYSRLEMNTHVPNMVNAGIHALGGPDSIMDENGLIHNIPYKGEYEWLKFYRDQIVIVMEVQRANNPFTNLGYRIKPASTWGTLTLADNGSGGLQLRGAGIHGLTVGITTDTTSAGTTLGTQGGFYITTVTGNFPVGYYNISSIDSANNLTIVNRAALPASGAAPEIAAGALLFSDVAVRSLSDPWLGIDEAPVGGYPLGDGFTYNAKEQTYTGFVPVPADTMGFLEEDIKPSHVIITYLPQYTHSLTGRTYWDNWLDYLKSIELSGNITENLYTKRPLSVT